MSKRHIRLGLLAFVAVLLVLAVAAATAAACPPRTHAADTVYLNGMVLTYGHDRWQSAVAVDDGVIVYVGNDRQARRYIGMGTEVVNLHGKMMMPGLADGHIHLTSLDVGFGCDMEYEGGSEDYILAKIKAALLRDDQIDMLDSNYLLECVNFEGESMLPAGTVLTRDMLDRLSLDPSEDPMGTGTTRPIFVRNADGHKYHVNSAAIENAGVTAATDTPAGSMIGHYGADAPAGFAPGDPNGFFADYYPPDPWERASRCPMMRRTRASSLRRKS